MAGQLVSVVIPAYNGAQFLDEALQSTFDQAYRPLEVIVVDDGSIDATAEVVDSFPEARCIRQGHAGEAAARNTGVRAASGELIAFLDADDRMAPGRLERQVEHLQAHPGVDLVLGRQDLFLEAGAEPPAWARGESVWSRLSPATGAGEQIPPGAMMARRTAFDQVGDYDSRFELAPDVDWIWRAHEAGLVLSVLDRVVLERRLHAGNATHDSSGSDRAVFVLLKARMDRARARR
jgi:glycosyltransferase involved in cell wall biosynthesis